MTRYRSYMVACVELQRDGFRGSISVRVLNCTEKSAPATRLRGMVLTMATCHRLLGGMCSVSLLMNLPEEFRQLNRRELE
eukprot:6182923-Pleurochrysis_carterae.AAC.3